MKVKKNNIIRKSSLK